ncbi:MAG: UMP kinase [Acidimicrobiia bacterium]|nr:UMP kinase [bacterium]MXZ06828.1 UMP kinase [Acidimicrobiia bacterium]MCY3580924.1 UMP kinase [bacterium]MCY3652106.1 UMP kinase [bacterium]MDE0642917.1 UMP kinase [bacterium]
MTGSPRRVLLKLSGEAFADPEIGYGISSETVRVVAGEIAASQQAGHQVGIVVGGGNIFRGVSVAAAGMDQVNADYMGMLATVINALALRDAIESHGVECRVQSAITMQQLAEPYIRLRAIRHLEKGRSVIFAAGSGNPFFTTDTAAALRAVEIGAEAMLKASKVKGIYSSDPEIDPDARLLGQISYMDFINAELKVMDTTAVTLCMDNDMPIVVFRLLDEGNILKAVEGEPIGTTVS